MNIILLRRIWNGGLKYNNKHINVNLSQILLLLQYLSKCYRGLLLSKEKALEVYIDHDLDNSTSVAGYLIKTLSGYNH